MRLLIMSASHNSCNAWKRTKHNRSDDPGVLPNINPCRIQVTAQLPAHIRHQMSTSIILSCLPMLVACTEACMHKAACMSSRQVSLSTNTRGTSSCPLLPDVILQLRVYISIPMSFIYVNKIRKAPFYSFHSCCYWA